MTKNRRIIAYLMVFLLIVASCIPATAMADETVSNPDAQLCGTLGMLIGDGTGLTNAYLTKVPTRIQAAVLYLRLKGLEKEAMAYKGASNFDDINKAIWAENVMAYLKAHPELGMVGMGDNKFSPDTYINAQGYYKILLEALGYKSGTDFAWEDTIAFANSKGLNKVASVTNFTLNDLATATVEALKASIKGSVDTLAGTLVRTGVFTGIQIDALTTAGVRLVSMSFEASVKSASVIKIKFNAKVTDYTKVTFSVSKDNVAIESLNGKLSDDGLELSITKPTNYDAGTYTVKIAYDNKVIDTKTVEILKEKISSIVFSPTIVVMTSDIKGEVNYTAYNQYGEDISKSALMKNIIWAASTDSVTVDTNNTKLVVTKNGTAGVSQLKDTPFVSLAGYDGSSNLVVSAKLDVSDGYGLIKDIKFLGIKNKDGKTEITVDSQDNFYIDYEAYDESGKIIDAYSLLSNVANFGVYSNNPSIAAHVVRDPNNTSKALIEIDTHTESGTSEIAGVVLSNGKKATINVEVKKGATLTNFVIEAPAIGVPINERVEIPYKAYDQNGIRIKDFNLINGKALFVAVDGGTATIVGEKSQTGEFILTGNFDQVSTYTIKVVIIEANKTIDYKVVTKAASVPTTISSIDRDIICDAIVENGEIKADFVKNPAFKIIDQNSNEVNLENNNIIGNKYYYIYVTSNDQQKVSVYMDKSIAYKDNEIILVGGMTRGSATVTFELCSDNDLIPTNGKEVLDVKDVTIANIDRKDIMSYSFAAIPTLYANSDITSTDKYSSISVQKQQYAGDIKVYGKMAGNKMVALDPLVGAGKNILTMTVTDPKKFDVDLGTKKILAKPYGNETTITDKLTAIIQGYVGVIPITIEINSSKEVPVAKSIEAVISPNSAIQRSKDSLSLSLSTFNSSIKGKELRSYNSSGYDAVKSDLYFVINDQYGVDGLTPAYFAITKTLGSSTITIDPTTGIISGTAYFGDQYIVNAVTNNGLIKTITINIQ